MSARVAVFASGGGSNLQALLDRFATDDSAEIVAVVSDREDAGALERARGAGIAALHMPVKGRDPRIVAGETLALLGRHDIDIIALAGYLRLVPAAVTAAFPHRILNIHPSLLPSFGGAGMYGRHVHEAVLRARCRVTGATVHEVNEHFDEGRILAQWPVPVLDHDTPETLAARVLAVEHALYPAVLSAVARMLRGLAPQAPAPGDVFRLMTAAGDIDAELAAVTALERR